MKHKIKKYRNMGGYYLLLVNRWVLSNEEEGISCDTKKKVGNSTISNLRVRKYFESSVRT